MTERNAFAIGASGGIKGALAAKRTRKGYSVTQLSRQRDGRDIADENSVSENLGKLTTSFDPVVVTTGFRSAKHMTGAGRGEKLVIDAVAIES